MFLVLSILGIFNTQYYCSDERDIQREIRNWFIRTNTLIRKFHRCSFQVKITLFKTYCLSM